jgi:hypothetical protein
MQKKELDGGAMRYQIEKQGDEIVIRFEDVGGNAQAVIDAIGRCRVNSWECSSGECAKIDSMASCGERGLLALRLRPRSDLSLDVATLGECLKYQLPEHLGAEK